MDDPRIVSFVTTEWLESILSGCAGKPIVVHEFKLSPGLEKGENYISTTVRIQVVVSSPASALSANEPGTSSASGPAAAADNYDDEQRQILHLFAKFLPPADGQREFAVKYNMFEREAAVYNDLLPAIENLFAGRGSNDVGEGGQANVMKQCALFDFYPKVFRADKNVIIMEDLGFDGFKMADRRRGLNVDEISLGLKAIARFHALTYAQARSEPGIAPHQYKDRFQWIGTKNVYECRSVQPLYADAPAAMRIVEAVKKFSSSISTTASDPETCLFQQDQRDLEEIIARLEAYAKEDFTAKVEEATLRTSEMDCFVLGDCWVNNMMFRYEESDDGQLKPVGIRLLDFQLVRFSQPLREVAFFFYSSASRECFQQQLTLLRIYYDEFLSVIENLPAELTLKSASSMLTRESYTFERMLEDYENCEEAGFLVSLAWLPVMVLTKDDFPADYGTGDFAEDLGGLMEAGLSGPAGRNVIERFLDHARRARSIGII